MFLFEMEGGVRKESSRVGCFVRTATLGVWDRKCRATVTLLIRRHEICFLRKPWVVADGKCKMHCSVVAGVQGP